MAISREHFQRHSSSDLPGMTGLCSKLADNDDECSSEEQIGAAGRIDPHNEPVPQAAWEAGLVRVVL